MEHEQLGIIYWNVLYRAHPEQQYIHLERLDNALRQRRAGAVVLCLSEATRTAYRDGLADRLNQRGYMTAYRPTSTLKPGVEEGVLVASRDIDFSERLPAHSPGAITFTELVAKRGIRNFKRRWHARLNTGNHQVATAHLSVIRPSDQELARTLSLDPVSVYGGDFNTLANKTYVDAFIAKGMVKLIDPSGRTTVPVSRRSQFGWELDHVLVDATIAAQSELEIGDIGPSNHRPLLVTVPC